MRVLAGFLCVVASSCTCGAPDPTHCTVAALPVRAAPIAGRATTITLGVTQTCAGDLRVIANRPPVPATSVRVEVFDPDNRVVAAEASAPARSATGGVFDTVTDVTFTPASAGVYTIQVSFEPGLGRLQAAISAAALRADAGHRIAEVDFPADCGDYALLEGGTPVCVGTTASGPELAIGSQRFSGSSFVVDGASVWRVLPSGTGWAVERLREDAGYFAPALVVVGTQQPSLTVWGDELWLGETSGSIAHAVPSGGGNYAVHRMFAPFPVGLGHATEGGALFAPSGPGLGSSVIWIPSDGGPAEGVQPAVARGVRVDEGGLWYSEGPGLATTDWRITSAVRTGALTLTAVVVPPEARLITVPLIPSAPVLPRAPNGGAPGVLRHGDPPVFEIYVPGPGFREVGSATARHAFARSTDGKTLKIIDR